MNAQGSERPRIFGRIRVTVVLAALAVVTGGPGCLSQGLIPSLRTVPPEWRNHHPWGPDANELRAAGQLPILHANAEMAEWDAWGREHLQDGDILFRYGKVYSPYEFITSRMISVASASPFSHNAIVHFQDGKPRVYDAEDEGIRDIPFDVWMLDSVRGTLAVKRLQPEYRCHIPGALAFCESAYLRNVPFDHNLHPEDDSLYCSEMLEKAFRSTGLTINDPVPLHCFPRYRRYRWLAPIVTRVTAIRTEDPVFAVGNADFGMYGSERLDTVYEGPRVVRGIRRSRPPTCPAVPYDPPPSAVETTADHR